MAQSVIELVGVDVVVGKLEVVAVGAEVAGDVVAVGPRVINWFMNAAGSVDGAPGSVPRKCSVCITRGGRGSECTCPASTCRIMRRHNVVATMVSSVVVKDCSETKW